jgi:hypothetical protein
MQRAYDAPLSGRGRFSGRARSGHAGLSGADLYIDPGVRWARRNQFPQWNRDWQSAVNLHDSSGAIVDRVLDRDRNMLEQIASEILWPTQHDRVVAAARGLYRGQPAGVPTWSGYRQTARLDISFPPEWMRTAR